MDQIAAWRTADGSVFTSEDEAAAYESDRRMEGYLFTFVVEAFPGWLPCSIYNMLIGNVATLRAILNGRSPTKDLRAFCEGDDGWPHGVIFEGLNQGRDILRDILNKK